MNPFLIVSMAVGLGILLIGGFYFLVYYQHPDDRNEAYIPKFVVLFGFVLAGATVLMFPLDVANNEGYAGCQGYDTEFCGGLDMELLWSIVFILIPVWVFCLIPFMTFYYEADDGMLMAGTAYSPNPVRRSRLGEALCYQIFVLMIVGAFFVGLYFTLSDAKIPVQDYTASQGIGLITADNAFTSPSLGDGNSSSFKVNMLVPMRPSDEAWLSNMEETGEETIVLQVDIPTFFANLMAWLGWFLFALFGGIGLAALPIDLILAYTNRPRVLDPVEYAEIQLNLRERVNELVEVGEMLKMERDERAQMGLKGTLFSFDAERRKAARDERQALIGFKQAVFLLEKDTEDFKAATVSRDSYNPLIPYASLFLGLCSIGISLLWFAHVILYVFPSPPLMTFLNEYFVWFDQWFPLFGVLSVALFTLYLLLCAVKGCFKFGIRFFLFHIHPMIPGKTYMSSFMFNTALVLLCALPVVQFSQLAFADYGAYSEIRQLFGVQIQNLEFFSWFWESYIFIYAFLGLSVVTALYLFCKPKDQAASGKELKKRLVSRRS
ncbi:hypothetical protein FisN_15Hh165 [Fistulifera solaris]|uniref:LMBR1 domain-containing protein 1 n=1 Tax=Fistulifera solaris TaxID=1519565 RepID=A0A1Z5JFE5_FISSO|nr:hypothetical protein FisN_15Hh165 [Fistulifera solaris]|eukprot:GAX12689.1 hypothetical protein FisN_15Hh165 [Fistulifera solaris]